MPKLNQIIAVVNGKKTQSQKALTDIYKRLQKNNLFNGLARTYRPLDEDGETQPDERQRVQLTVAASIEEARQSLADLMNAVATQDWANCEARADVRVGGQTIIDGVPVTHLLFLEKKLVDLATFIDHIPVLDPAEEWEWSDQTNCYRSKSTVTNRTKKVPRAHVAYEATKDHPAQVETYHEDVKVGEWTLVKFSGAVSAIEKQALAGRVQQLQEAVKFAREQANGIDVTQREVAKPVLDFIFGEA